MLPVEAVLAIGGDAVMVLDESSLTAPEDAPDDVARPATERNVRQKRKGRPLGEIRSIDSD